MGKLWVPWHWLSYVIPLSVLYDYKVLKKLLLADFFDCFGIEWEFLCVRKETLEERLTHRQVCWWWQSQISVFSQNFVTVIISTKHATRTHKSRAEGKIDHLKAPLCAFLGETSQNSAPSISQMLFREILLWNPPRRWTGRSLFECLCVIGGFILEE